MLFSNDAVAQAINLSFEPVWESVRPVPIVRIDFGNGQTITRTLHGNIATYVCTAEGEVLDILPGIYTPEAYVDALDQLRILSSNLALHRDRPQWTEAQKHYHRYRVEALKKNEDPGRLEDMRRMVAFSKANIEVPVERLVRGLPASAADSVVHADRTSSPPADLAKWKALLEDTRLNEKARRLLIHEKLATGSFQAEQLTHWLYKEVLHSDLDDPYLGLGKLLFATYPFTEEDRR